MVHVLEAGDFAQEQAVLHGFQIEHRRQIRSRHLGGHAVAAHGDHQRVVAILKFTAGIVVPHAHALCRRIHRQHLMMQKSINPHLGVLLARAGNQPAGIVIETTYIIGKAARAVGEVSTALVDGNLRIGHHTPQLGGGGHSGCHAANYDCFHPRASSGVFFI